MGKSINDLFFVKVIGVKYCVFSSNFVFKRLTLFGKDFFYIKHIGFDVSVFDDRARANAYLRVKKQEYIDAKRFV